MTAQVVKVKTGSFAFGVSASFVAAAPEIASVPAVGVARIDAGEAGIAAVLAGDGVSNANDPDGRRLPTNWIVLVTSAPVSASFQAKSRTAAFGARQRTNSATLAMSSVLWIA